MIGKWFLGIGLSFGLTWTPVWALQGTPGLSQIPSDQVSIKGGRVLHGELTDVGQDEAAATTKSPIVIRTEAGGQLTLERGKAIGDVKRAGELFAAYREFVGGLGSTPDDHWKAYEWCAAQPGGKQKYARQMDFHLRQIVAQDMNDSRAHQLLGNTEINGRWVNEEQFFRSHGYHRDSGTWRSLLATDLKTTGELSDQVEGSTKSGLSRWLRNIGKMNDAQLSANRVAVAKELQALANPLSLPLLATAFDKEKRVLVQEMYLEAFASHKTSFSLGKLVDIAIRHTDAGIRDRAVSFLKQFPPEQICNQSTQYLASPNNLDVNRAGLILGETGSRNAILPLIRSLETRHKIKNPAARQAGSINPTFDNQGGGGLQLGSNGPAVVETWVANQGVHDALRRITGRDQGTKPVDWIAWYIDNHSLGDVDLRADD